MYVYIVTYQITYVLRYVFSKVQSFLIQKMIILENGRIDKLQRKILKIIIKYLIGAQTKYPSKHAWEDSPKSAYEPNHFIYRIRANRAPAFY